MSMEQARQAFLQPGDDYTPIPFWFWNDELTEAELARQIHDFHDKGVAGFVIHPRKGLPRSIPYMSEKYLGFVRFAVEEAARLSMRVVLYDEAMYPSGSAHGMVVWENPAYASRCLRMEVSAEAVPAGADVIAVCAARVAEGRVSDVEAIQPVDGAYPAPGDGRVLLAFREGYSGGTIRGVHENEDDGESDAPPSADLLNPEAVRAFIRLTHEGYWRALQEHFGRTIIAVFTDEPDITGRNAARGCMAWTAGFLDEFLAQGCRVADLPALWLDAGPETENIRRRYRRAVNRRLNETYYGQLADWCQAHGVALTGHPAKSWDIGLLRSFQLPGQDVVWRFVGPGQGVAGPDSVLAKCASDAARHAGRARNANECFGCCGPDRIQWAFTMDDMKWYMDWLFVRGTNLLYPHAFFYSLRDGRGEERPPDVGPNNLWWPWYGQIARYMRRMSWLMTGGVNQAEVAVLCEEDRLPWEVCVPLYEHQIEFNYLQDTELPACRVENGQLCLGQQRYSVLITGDVPLDENVRDALGLQPCLVEIGEEGLYLADEDDNAAEARGLGGTNVPPEDAAASASRRDRIRAVTPQRGAPVARRALQTSSGTPARACGMTEGIQAGSRENGGEPPRGFGGNSVSPEESATTVACREAGDGWADSASRRDRIRAVTPQRGAPVARRALQTSSGTPARACSMTEGAQPNRGKWGEAPEGAQPNRGKWGETPEGAQPNRGKWGETPEAPLLRVSWVRKEGADFFLMVNEGEEEIRCGITPAVRGAAEWWDPWTGRSEPAVADREGRYALRLSRRGSLILCVDREAEPLTADDAVLPFALPEYPVCRPLAGQTWRVTPMTGDTPPFSLTADDEGCLPSWTEQPGLARYSGWAAYETELSMPRDGLLTLGEVHAMSRLFLDGREAGMCMWSPHQYLIPAGRHALRLEICNTLANAYEGAQLPSGLMGPVTLHSAVEEQALSCSLTP
ncbi:MAG: hypothetical protein ACI4ML_09235 [Aristaeellaceae bacterium]